MATLVLQFAGAALGGAIGGPIGAIAGRAIGALVGASIDGAILNGGGARAIEGPRLTEMSGLAATEGAPIPRIYGRARIGGELIWATRFEEVVNIVRHGGGAFGGKGGLFGGGGGESTETTYSYFANIAVGLCEGPVAFVRRVWADGRELDLTTLAMRVHRGDESQTPDPLILAKEGAANAPAYRGLAYVVFERLPLAGFGNRIPQLSFEVVRPVGALNADIRGVNLIPGAGEFAYAPASVFRHAGAGVSRPENVNQLTHASDLRASLDQLQALCPNLASVTLIVTWFGGDLRAGHCALRPKVEIADKMTTPAVWSVAGVERAGAAVVSVVSGRPAFGGSPSDDSVIAAIGEIRARGWKVNLHPFIMMDVPAGNARRDPWTGAASQPSYPWRGDITVDPAPGVAGTVDGSAAAAAQIAAFVGACAPADFSLAGGVVVYSGAEEWSLRRLVLHYANLAVAAGGVDAFILSSELRGLTRVRGAGGSFPMTAALVALAADARTVLGAATKITYAADWTEYGGLVPAPGELAFPLDALWASPHIDVVAIDWYPPLSDWRDGAGHADAAAANDAADLAYLSARVAGGEGYDWYYASDADRAAQVRQPITDGAYGKPWVYRVKDIVAWWSNPHVARASGVETGATGWVPGSKPVWLTEVGCPAVDRGANGPNAFPDVKSAAAALPPFSRGVRDDLVAMRAIAATVRHFTADDNNPVSPFYDGRMLDVARTHLWAWDARPFPAFPALGGVWGDAANFETGHWLNGRLEGAGLDETVRAIAADYDIPDLECVGLDAFIDGYVIDRPMALRAALEPLANLYGFGLRGGRPSLIGGRRAPSAAFAADDLVPDRNGRAIERTRAQETELPAEATIGFTDGDNLYRRAAAASRRLSGLSRRQSSVETGLVARRGAMQALADAALQRVWTARETVRFTAPPTALALETGDHVLLAGDGPRLFEITRLSDGPGGRAIEARAVDDYLRGGDAAAPGGGAAGPPPVPGAPRVELLDLPLARSAPAALQYVAAFADPWPGALTAWRRSGETAFVAERLIPARAMIGALIDPLFPGPLWKWDRGASFRVLMRGGTVASIGESEALAGDNAFAIRKPDGTWEIIVASEAALVDANSWRLSKLLRGLAGSEQAAAIAAPSGASIVRLDAAVAPLVDSLDRVGQLATWRFGPSSLDHGDPRFIEIASAATAIALKPFAPVHVRARRTADGVAFSWVRRTRIDGDAWEVAEVPLGEETERYELQIFSAGGALLRTLASPAPSLLYAAADEAADFGAPQTVIEVALAQMSIVAGRGFQRSGAVPVR